MSYDKYLKTITGNFKKAIKVEWLNHDETVNFEFTDSLYDINVDLSVNYQNGSRRTCTLTLNNDRNKFPINFNSIWFGQKFKLWMGIYIDNKTPYYFPQGVFYVSNPNEVYQPNNRTIKINGVDKWAFLDGTLHGKLHGIYQTNIGVSLYDATKDLLTTPYIKPSFLMTSISLKDFFDVKNGDFYFKYDGKDFVASNADKNMFSYYNNSVATTELIAKEDVVVSFTYEYACNTNDGFYLTIGDTKIADNLNNGGKDPVKANVKDIKVYKGQSITFQFSIGTSSSGKKGCIISNMNVYTNILPVDPVHPFISPDFVSKKVSVDGDDVEVWKCPYTAKVEKGRSYADVLLEYANIMCANIYYDVNGRLTIEPMIDTADDITDTNKEILWHYTIEEKTFLGLNQTYNFDKVYNDIIVLGNIVNGRQFKARVQNKNPMSDTCIQKIGLKTKDPFEDNQYYSDEQCKELAIYYAKIDTILQKSGNIDSTPLYHLDVNKLISVSTPNNNMSKELFLITGFTLNSSGSMSLNITSVNVLKDFSVVEVDVYE